MTDIVSTIGARATRPALIEYTEVLTILDELIATSKNETEPSILASRARQVVQIIRQLKTMEITSLTTTDEIKSLARALTVRSSALIQIVESPGATLQQIADAFSDWISGDDGLTDAETLVNNALDPTLWDSNLAIRDSVIDYLFFEYYRSAEVMSMQQVGMLGERLQVSEKYLDSLNLIYEGATWNPGEEFINLEGQLQDSDSGSWYTKFLVDDGMTDRMATGVSQIRSMYESGLLPDGSQERETAVAILSKWDTSFTLGGYGALAAQEYVARMWSDKSFRRTLQDGINGASNLNERLQHDISKILMQYDTFTRSAAQMAARMNTSLRTVARGIQQDR